ncbi:ABC transporter ATP-binding protein [Neorhodopirellula lusitana]|uniref:ABC transporter ATP-binding protein n=1 Tax=Neorhodopirellula lusitana TaxID=445327 RepID=UPI00384DABA9
MTQPIIQVENLGKSYLVGHESAQKESYTALRDVAGRTIKNFGRKTLDMARGRQIVQGDEVEEFWALKDVSFDVNEGEVVGIIGRNGAGKSTLLKVLSRITEPTQGRVTLRGRVASLLEVGTGFHPELSGRENIFLNGAILGMTRREIKQKFDEIVEFAGVERFLDTPVKRYSSGMYVRLAFAVAAHLEPEILVIDEVLAVGDAEFQKRCLGKMKEVANGGRTVLFVSHQLDSVRRLTNACVLMENGTPSFIGETEETIKRYLATQTIKVDGNETRSIHEYKPRGRSQTGTEFLSILSSETNVDIDQDINFTVELATEIALQSASICCELVSLSAGAVVSCFVNGDYSQRITLERGVNEIEVSIKSPGLLPGRYGLNIGINSQLGSVTLDYVEGIPLIEISENIGGTPMSRPSRPGFILPSEVRYNALKK